jgi:hypothetical protein
MTKLPILSAGVGLWLALGAGACQTDESKGDMVGTNPFPDGGTVDARSTDASKGDIMNPNSVIPTANGSVFSFQFGETLFAVDANQGGRIVTFASSGRNVLTGPAVNASNFGSTFWPSPQSDWNWPPPPEIDSAAYTPSLDGAVLSLSGATAAALGLAVEKKFSADGAAGMVTVEYTLANRGSKARQVAPWEITRVAAGGLTFFPMGEGGPRKGPQDLLNPTIVNGVAWFAYNAATITADQKLFADGLEGWIAHVDGDLLLVKSFGDTLPAQAAPGEAEIELYADAAHTYVEVENQGAYVNLAPGAATTWTVRWMLRKLDLAATPAGVGSAALVDLVRSLVK